MEVNMFTIKSPLDFVKVTSKFGPRVIFGKNNFHTGVDYAPVKPKTPGDKVKAVADGLVRVAATDPEGYGRYVVIDHGSYCTLYAHLDMRLVVVGTKVTAGQIIGTMGNTGRSTGVHLHFELRLTPWKTF
jgi:murein DD-endopeptidase MepM/ murein hydrolase activator NlpD